MNIPEGYYPRLDGSEAHYPPGKGQECDSCGCTTSVLYGFERDWPEDPDLFVCSDCLDEWLILDSTLYDYTGEL